MRMSLISNLNNKTPIESCIRDLTDAREAGFSRLWMTQMPFDVDLLTVLAAALREVPDIEVASGVVPIQNQHPTLLAQRALTLNIIGDGRFTLGIGVTHRAVTEGMQLWVKLTGLSSNLPALAIAARNGGADAVCMMGRFMGLVPDLETFAPVLGTSAAYGGGWALPVVCRFLALTRKATGGTFPLMGTNGVRSGGDVLRMALCGASATELLSVVMHEGFGGLTRVLNELDSFLAARDLTFRNLIGRSADALTTYGEQPETPGRWRDFVPPETLSETEPLT